METEEELALAGISTHRDDLADQAWGRGSVQRNRLEGGTWDGAARVAACQGEWPILWGRGNAGLFSDRAMALHINAIRTRLVELHPEISLKK